MGRALRITRWARERRWLTLLRGGAQCDLIGDERHSVVTRADSAHVLGSVCLQTKYHRDVMHLLRKPVQALMWLMMKGDNVQKASDARAVQFLTHDEDARHAFAHYKVPRYIRFVPEMPMTITGKVQKFVMRDKMIEELGLSAARTA